MSNWLTTVEQGWQAKIPTVLAAAFAWEAWTSIEPLQHQAWLGILLVAALLRDSGKVSSQLMSLNAGLRAVPRERRCSPDRMVRLLALFDAVAEAASVDLDRSIDWRWPKTRWSGGCAAAEKLKTAGADRARLGAAGGFGGGGG